MDDSQPSTASARFLELAEQYAAAGNVQLEAMCRYQRAECLHSEGPAQLQALGAQLHTGGPDHSEYINERRKERAKEYRHAATLFDSIGLVQEAGRAWYGAAREHNYVGLLDREYREECYITCNTAADRFEAADDWWGKGTAEALAATTLRQDQVDSPPDPRSLPMLQRSVDSFTRAGRLVDAAASSMLIVVYLTQTATNEEWMAAAIEAFHRYEKARPSLAMAHDRERYDMTLGHGVRVLTRQVRKAATEMIGHPLWAELVWLLEQAPKARSFQDQQLQDDAWAHLVMADERLSELIKGEQQLQREHDGLDRKIRLTVYLQKAEGDATPGKELRDLGKELRDKEEKLRTAQRAVRERFKRLEFERPGSVALASTSPVFPSELQKCLKQGEAYLGFRWSDGAPLRTLVTTSTFTASLAYGVSSDYAEYLANAARTRESVSHTNPADAARLIGRLPAGIDTLIISPDSLLMGIPWHLLPTTTPDSPNSTLGDRYTIAVVPAAGVLRHLRGGRSGAASNMREAAYAGVACAGPNLTYVDQEVEEIRRNYFETDQNSISLTTADCHRFLETGCSARLLHLACHAERNGLLLSRDGTWTTPMDLTMPGRSFGADILLMTGCYAGDFVPDVNNEFLGIVRELVVATGARAAIISVAPVDDEAGPIFADLVVSALTGHNPDRPWRTPAQPLTVGRAVAWARRKMAKLNPEDVAPLLPGTVKPCPGDRRWWSPWFVVGDPSASLTR